MEHLGKLRVWRGEVDAGNARVALVVLSRQTSLMLRPILIAGPTASGKSALALAFAERRGGVIINADSMQVYRELRIITARPSAEDEACVPHRLYGHVGAAAGYSVARWLADVEGALDEARHRGWRPIIVGGTGLYFKALTEGLSPVPEVPDAIRHHWRNEAQRIGAGGLHATLAARDRVMADRLNPADAQRLTRALEVLDATGRSLADWQAQSGTPLVAIEHADRIVIAPPRETLHKRSDQRFAQMLETGALEEVGALMQLELAPVAPVMKAIGVRPLAAHLAGAITRVDAIARGQQETRQYIKRQQTWLKRHMYAWKSIRTIINCGNTSSFMHLIDD